MVFPWLQRPATTEPATPVYGPPPPPSHAPAPDPEPVVAKKVGPVDPTAMLPYVDAHPQAAPVDPHLKETIDNAKSMSIGFQLAAYSHDMDGAGGKAFLNTLDQITDPALRHKVMEHFQTMTGQSLHGFITTSQDWNNDGSHRDQEAALSLIDGKRDQVEATIAAMPKEERAKREKAANDYAVQVLSATTAHDDSSANMTKMFGALGGRDPVDIELIRQSVSKHTHGESNLYSAIDNGSQGGDEDEAVAMLAGDRVTSARAAIQNGLIRLSGGSLDRGLGPRSGTARWCESSRSCGSQRRAS